MSRQKKKSSSKKNEDVKNDVRTVEIKGIIFIAAGILTAIAIYTNLAGFLSTFSQRISHLLIGTGTVLLPPFLLYLGYSYFKGRGAFDLGKGFVGTTILYLIMILICATFYIQRCNEPDLFGDNLFTLVSNVADDRISINGGVVGYIISYPLYKLIGFVGSYLLYVTALIISGILSFNFSVFRLSEMAKMKGIEYRNREKKKKSQDYKVKDDFIKFKKKNVEKPVSSKEDFLKGVDHKIKILDFMKNSNIDYEYDDEFNVEENKDIPIVNIMEDYANEEVSVDKHVKKPVERPVEKHKKKETIDNDIKDVVNKEIDSVINSETEKKEYVFPSTELLKGNVKTELNSTDKKELIDSADKLTETLGCFGVEAKVLQVSKGPSVTRYELQPSPGVKVSKIVNLADDIALALAASGVRIEAPIPGKSAVGIEVPNKSQTPVSLREVLDSKEFVDSKNKLAFALGKDIGGACVVGDLSKMPHTLIAGATGSGKSVCINSLIISILYKYSPDDVKLLMVDPKVVELNVYNGIPHLLIPVVTEPKKAAAALNWAVNEMTKRYNQFAEKGVRNIDSYNNLYQKGLVEEKMPYIVIIVDELADLMMVCPHDVEDYIGRLAQMARAAGMHLVIATQRPSVDVITGVIKANIPSRISFAVSSQVDSRTILDSSGAEKLLGRGDMLYAPVGENKPLRVQGCFISEEEVESVVEFIKRDHEAVIYEESIIDHINNEAEGKDIGGNEDDADELLSEAIKIVVEYEQASTSFLQRRLRIGFNRASRIMDQLEERGVISQKDGSRPRQVLIGKADLENNSSGNDEI